MLWRRPRIHVRQVSAGSTLPLRQVLRSGFRLEIVWIPVHEVACLACFVEIATEVEEALRVFRIDRIQSFQADGAG